jgi:hypothetical protein
MTGIMTPTSNADAPSTAHFAPDWVSIPEPVSLTAAAWRACVRTADGAPETAGAENLRYALFRFSLARRAARSDTLEIPFRVPVEIRPGIWRRVTLIAHRNAVRDGWEITVVN